MRATFRNLSGDVIGIADFRVVDATAPTLKWISGALYDALEAAGLFTRSLLLMTMAGNQKQYAATYVSRDQERLTFDQSMVVLDLQSAPVPGGRIRGMLKSFGTVQTSPESVEIEFDHELEEEDE